LGNFGEGMGELVDLAIDTKLSGNLGEGKYSPDRIFIIRPLIIDNQGMLTLIVF
jgi:hypothetical protein